MVPPCGSNFNAFDASPSFAWLATRDFLVKDNKSDYCNGLGQKLNFSLDIDLDPPSFSLIFFSEGSLKISIATGCIGSSLATNYVLYPVGRISSSHITSLVQPSLSSSSDGRVSVLGVHEGCEGLELTDFPMEGRGLDFSLGPTSQYQEKTSPLLL